MKKSKLDILYGFIVTSFLCLALFSIFKLISFEKNIETTYETFEGTPIVISSPIGKKNDQLIFISHGFAGSTTFMRPIAIALAEAGFITIRFDYLGHGKHPDPYSGDITSIKGATQSFVKQTDIIINHFLNKYNLETGLIIGHSMASDIVIRTAKKNLQIEGVIGISTYSDAVTETDPKNLLILNGQWEPPLRAKARNILTSLGIENPIEGKLYGEFNNGTARKAIAVQNSDHVGVLYSSNTQREIIAWANQIYQENFNIVTNRIGLWAGLLFLSLFILFICSLKFFPIRKLERGTLRFRNFIFSSIVATVTVPYALKYFTPTIVAFPAHNHLISHLLLMSIILIVLTPIKVNKSLLLNFNLPIFAFLFVTFSLGFGTILNSYVSTFYLSVGRIGLFLLMAIACVPIMIVVQSFYQVEKYGWAIGNLGKLFILISLSISIWLDLEKLFILGYAVILFIGFSIIFGFLANLLNRKYNDVFSIGTANGLVLAWTFSTALPIYIP